MTTNYGVSKMQFFRKKELQPMIPWEQNMPMTLVSVSDADKSSGSPKEGDMIAFNPKDPTDMWLVAKDYIAENYDFVHESV